MRKAGNQECFTPIFSCLPAFLILTIQCGWLIERLLKVRAQKVDFRARIVKSHSCLALPPSHNELWLTSQSRIFRRSFITPWTRYSRFRLFTHRLFESALSCIARIRGRSDMSGLPFCLIRCHFWLSFTCQSVSGAKMATCPLFSGIGQF
jgi:hypothetical protein